ncbi:MAG: hypothetical protein U0791_23240 [Gemmataceae bacterium]
MAIGGSSGGGAGAIRAGRAFVELFAEDSKLQRVLAAWKGRLLSFAGFAVKLGSGLLAGGGALLAPLTTAIGTLQDLAKQGSIANAFGLTAEEFTGIAGVAKSAGEDTREFIESLVTLGKVASEGAAGKGQVATDFFKELNLNAAEFAALRPDKQFFKFFEAVRTVEDPLRRVRLLMVAFGEDGGKYLLPLLDKSDAQLREMARGFAVSSDAVASATQASLAYAEASALLSRTWQGFVVAVAAPLAKAITLLSSLLVPLNEFITENAALVAGIVGLTAIMLGAGAAFIAFGGMLAISAYAIGGFAAGLAGLTAAWAIAKALFLAIISPVGLVVIAVTALVAALAFLWSTTEDGQGAIAQIKAGIGELGVAIKGIAKAFEVGDLALAGKIAFTALRLEFAKMLGWWQDRWNAFKGFFVDGWHDAVKLLSLELSGAAEWMEKLFVDIGQAIRKNVGETFLDVLRQVLDKYIAIMEATDLLGVNTGQIAAAKRIRESLDLSPEEAQKKRDAAEKARQGRDKQIEDEARREQEKRNKAREADKGELLGLIQRLQKELEAAIAQAEKPIPPKIENDLARKINTLNRMVSSGAGGFGGPLRAQFGVIDKVEQKQLDALENIDKGVGQLPQAMAEQFERRWRLQ